ncbi:MAG: tetratricopeptide repeat protein [Methanosarcinales archaeon]|nr:tetratricopeptide repeat protein [Methanosarcinales archaeon]MCK4812055.1 tetratricopeptide repeat protein [Methanosarcinales archaeon]
MNELRLAKGRNCLIFAIADNSEEFVEQVESSGLHVNEIHLNGNINLLEVLSDWEQTSEDTVYFVEGVRSQFPWVLGYLNLHRDIFYEIKRPIVIFGSEYEITEITKYAPDLWRFRSRTYDFTEKKEILGDFLPTPSEQSVAAEERSYYDLPIFEVEAEDKIKERITVDNYLLEIVKEDHKRAELYMSLAIAYLKLQEFEVGKKYFDKALEVRKKANDNIGISIDYMRFSWFYAFKGDYNKAIEYCREAIRINPDNAAAHYNLGVLLDNSERYDEAEKEYREAIRIDPDYVAAHSNLGVLLNNSERYDEAEKEYREAIRIDPDYVAAHSNLGVLLDNSERYDEAEKEYREAIRTDPDYATAHYNLGVLLADLKRYDEAEKEYREAIRINPDDATAHYNLGVLLADLKRYDEAEKEYREAIRADPDHAEAHGNLGALLLKTGRSEEAKNEFNIAKQLFENQGRDDDVKKVEELLANT